MNTRRLLLFLSVAILTRSVASGEARCPGNVESIRYHPVGLSAIAVSVAINRTGPYEFLVDTGSEVTVIEPSLAAELNLESQQDVNLFAIGNHSRAELARPDLIEVGPFAVTRPVVVVAPLRQLQRLDPKIRGLLGGSFLAHFDLLIDYAHMLLCFDETNLMRDEVHGQLVPIIEPSDLQQHAFAHRPLIRAHLSGEDPRDVLLILDSASNTPLLYTTPATPAWLLRNHQRFGSSAGAGSGASFAILPSIDVRIGSRVLAAIAFVVPLSAADKVTGQDGLLPTALFSRVFISYANHGVIFDPR